MDGWANGDYTAAFTTELIAKNMGATGACSIYALIVEMDYDNIMREDDDK